MKKYFSLLLICFSCAFTSCEANTKNVSIEHSFNETLVDKETYEYAEQIAINSVPNTEVKCPDFYNAKYVSEELINQDIAYLNHILFDDKLFFQMRYTYSWLRTDKSGGNAPSTIIASTFNDHLFNYGEYVECPVIYQRPGINKLTMDEYLYDYRDVLIHELVHIAEIYSQPNSITYCPAHKAAFSNAYDDALRRISLVIKNSPNTKNDNINVKSLKTITKHMRSHNFLPNWMRETNREIYSNDSDNLYNITDYERLYIDPKDNINIVMVDYREDTNGNRIYKEYTENMFLYMLTKFHIAIPTEDTINRK